MKTKKILFPIIALAAIVVLLGAGSARSHSAGGRAHPHYLTGTWINDVTIDNPPPGVTNTSYRTLITFTFDGGLTETSWSSGAELIGNGHGRWDRKGKGQFALTAIAIWPGAVLKGRSTITLSNSSDQYTSVFRVDV